MCSSSNRYRPQRDNVIDWTEPSGISARAMRPLTMKLESVFTGSYQPQPKGAAGAFMLRVRDAGEPGRPGDLFCVSLIDGAYDAYRNCGALGGGNIQVH